MGSSDRFAAAARASSHVFWRIGSACQEWTVTGDASGTVTRVAPAPSLKFAYRIAHDDLEMHGDPSQGAIGEQSLESSCSERVPLKAVDATEISLGDGAWYRTRDACMNEAALPAPGPCSAPLATTLVADPDAPNLFAYVYDHSGTIAVIVSFDGKLSCETRTFRARGGAHELVQSRKTDGAWHETAQTVAVADETIQIGSGDAKVSLPIVAVSRAMVLVGGYPWFVDVGRCTSFIAQH
jgi:hypothetical protein